MSSNQPNLQAEDSLMGLVLAGGTSSRIGEDKALLEFHGCSQIVYCRKTLRPFCQDVYVSVRTDQSQEAARCGESRIPDCPDFIRPGPMAGILSALRLCPGSAWLVVACDLPGITTALIKELLSRRDTSCFATAFRDPGTCLPEPLCAVYEPRVFPSALDYYRSGEVCPRKFLIKSPVRLLDLPVPDALFNVNTQHDKKSFFARQSG